MASDLSGERLASLKQRLEQRYEKLRAEVRRELLAADSEGFLDLAGRVHDPGDESVADLLVDVGLAVVDLHIDAIRETEAALLRLRTGTYGTCVDCGTRIGDERLLTEPTATRCVTCQEIHERAFVQPGRATL